MHVKVHSDPEFNRAHFKNKPTAPDCEADRPYKHRDCAPEPPIVCEKSVQSSVDSKSEGLITEGLEPESIRVPHNIRGAFLKDPHQVASIAAGAAELISAKMKRAATRYRVVHFEVFLVVTYTVTSHVSCLKRA